MGGSSSVMTASSAALPLGPPVDAIVGVNAFIDDPLDTLAAFGTVREYHSWTVNDGNGEMGYAGFPDNQLQFSLWNGFWDFDAYYTGLKARGVVAFPAVQGSVAYLGNRMPPIVTAGADRTNPASYRAHADFMFQFAARYGAVAVPDGLLKLAANQERRSGLNLLRYVEDGNEPDNNWDTGDGSLLFSPDAYAAMASADYDGDQGRLGATFGVKSADPEMKMVMAGLAGSGGAAWSSNVIAYFQGIKTWSDTHRAGSFPADVLNMHIYCFGPDGFGVPNPRPAISPEACDLKGQLAAVVGWRDANLPGKELWLTEFGYDTDPASNLRAPQMGSASAQVVQAQWLVRSMLAIAEAGIDRATLYMLRDVCSAADCNGHNVQFNTSGVTTEKDQWNPKPSYFFISAFRKALTGKSWVGTPASGNTNVRIAAFKGADGSGAYAVWAPTSEQRVLEDVVLSVPTATEAQQILLADQMLDGIASALTITDGRVTVDVTETPLIVRVNHMP